MVDPVVIENFFVTRLTPITTPLPVKPFPNINDIRSFAENVRSAVGAVTIAMRRITNAAAGEHGSEFLFHPQFMIFSKSLRTDTTGHHGAYSVIKSIVENIHEKKLTIDGELFTCYVEDSYYVGRDEDLFAYAIDTVLVPKLSRI